MGSIGDAINGGIEAVAERISKYGILEGAGNIIRKLGTNEAEVARSAATRRITKTLNGVNITIPKNDYLKIGEKVYQAGETVKLKTMDEATEALSRIGSGLSLSDIPEDKLEENFYQGAANVRKAFRDAIEASGLSEKAVANKVKKFDSAVDTLATELYGGIDSLDDIVEDSSRIKKGLAAVQGYFTDPEKGKARRGVAELYAGTAIATRYLSGGDLTHNKQGERDIAGIPFI